MKDEFGLLRDKIKEDVDNKRAYPELIFKQAIVLEWLELQKIEVELRRNHDRTGSFIKRDIIAFKGQIIEVFCMVKHMIKDSTKKGRSEGDLKLYDAIYRIENFSDDGYNVKDLINYRNYLGFWLHKLNLTNLLLSTGISLAEKFENEF